MCQTATPEELAQYEAGYQAWLKELEKALASGDQAKIDEAYENGK